ncbi:hypothetical protein CO615_00015 [Lysobacteraceae bacterium NML75-0749]|nr:hypothetical protein CO615_00015 [Xanthomonadaceae bacterium NML75-0749]
MRCLIASLTVKPLLWAVAVLLVLLLGSWWAHRVQIGALQVQVRAAEEARDAARSERDNWESATVTAAFVADANNEAIKKVRGLLEQQQAACLAIGEQNRQAAERADAVARRAERELSDYRRRAAGAGAGCEAALKQMEVACPALSNY